MLKIHYNNKKSGLGKSPDFYVYDCFRCYSATKML